MTLRELAERIEALDDQDLSGWTSNPEAIRIAEIVADKCQGARPHGAAPQRYAMIYQAAGMGAYQALRRVEALEAENARMRDALELAANRLHRTVLEYEPNSTGYYEMSEWAREARAALKGGSDEG